MDGLPEVLAKELTERRLESSGAPSKRKAHRAAEIIAGVWRWPFSDSEQHVRLNTTNQPYARYDCASASSCWRKAAFCRAFEPDCRFAYIGLNAATVLIAEVIRRL